MWKVANNLRTVSSHLIAKTSLHGISCSRKPFPPSVLQKDFFALFGLTKCVVAENEKAWTIKLKASYRKAQMVYHPDKQITESASREVSDLSTNLNIAYEAMSNPYGRLKHIIEMCNDSTEEQEIQKQLHSSSYLTEMLDLNEQLHGALLTQLIPQKYAALQKLRRDVESSISRKLLAAQNSYAHGEVKRLKELYYELSYLRSILNRINKYAEPQ